MGKCLKVALVQMCVGSDKLKNLAKASALIRKAKKKGAGLVILPECFNTQYDPKNFEKEAETFAGGPTAWMLQQEAKNSCVYIVGGTFPEKDCQNIFNTCTVWNPKGELLATLKKLHLFDVDIDDVFKFKESNVMTKGDAMATCEIAGFKVGLGVGYDIRFEELAKLYRIEGCHMLVYPAAFHRYTGCIHYEILQRARAVDNQVFVCSATQARAYHKNLYPNFGFSQITDPWGKIVCRAADEETIIYATLKLNAVKVARGALPIFDQRRTDIYETAKKIK